METVCLTEDSCFAYPAVIPGASAHFTSDSKPESETVTVTVHGLRRLILCAIKAQQVVSYCMFRETMPDMAEMYARFCTPEKLKHFINELTTIWCESDLVMSRLFVTPDGKAVRHKDDEVDAASIPPWEKATEEPVKQHNGYQPTETGKCTGDNPPTGGSSTAQHN